MMMMMMMGVCVVGLPIIMLVSINTVLATYAQHYE